GNGAIGIEEANVLAGDILLEAPVDLMAQIINTPSEKFQDKLATTMSQWMTSLQTLLSNPPSRDEIKHGLVEAFQSQLGISMELGTLLPDEKAFLEKLIEDRRQKEWIFGKDLEYQELVTSDVSQSTKIRGGIGVHEATYKAGKMVRITMVSIENTIERISISGDFFTQPYLGAISQLEDALKGASLEKPALQERMTTAFQSIGLRTLGASPDDFVEAILKAKKSGLME
ncbi:MAG: hypothetical protein KAS38_15415, partial [Anaerolineales bacterium]|nr:hypothetical protein [Anaerolineales bacterium]